MPRPPGVPSTCSLCRRTGHTSRTCEKRRGTPPGPTGLVAVTERDLAASLVARIVAMREAGAIVKSTATLERWRLKLAELDDKATKEVAA